MAVPSTRTTSSALTDDCAVGSAHTLVSPCTAAAAPQPLFPIPSVPLVEGGIDTDPSQPYGDHHMLLLDADTCRLWELYHCYPDPKSGWDIFGSAFFDLRSNALRPAGWTSADAAGFPILPLLLRADEASSGTIAHALRFTLPGSVIPQSVAATMSQFSKAEAKRPRFSGLLRSQWSSFEKPHSDE